jgi:phospholipase/carboxylesterase
VPIAEHLPTEASAANRKLPIFMAHGSFDPVIPLARAEESGRLLQSLGYALEWREYSMPHSVCPEELADIGVWLKEILEPRE